MHYSHIASDKGASICERSLLSFVIRVLILHTKRTFQSAKLLVNDSHFVNYGMIFVFGRVGVVYNSNLKTNCQNLMFSRIKLTYMATLVPQDHCCVF